MSLLWPRMLIFLLAVPACVVGYVMLTRKRSTANAALGTMGSTGRQRLGARRHLPVLLYLLGFGAALFGLARPTMVLDLPRQEGNIILAFDTSTSMRADDVAPSRLEQAKRLATEFADNQPSGIRLGVVSFGRGGQVLAPLTNQTPEIIAAIERVSAEGGTSLGGGIFAALNAVADQPITAEADPASGDIDYASLEVGFYGNAVIILLTDGEDTADVEPLDVATLASNAGVRVFPIGIGTATGSVVEVDGFSLATALDEDLLRAIADATEGSYSNASDADLVQLYDDIDRKLTVRGEETELTGAFAGLAALLLATGALCAQWLFGRMP